MASISVHASPNSICLITFPVVYNPFPYSLTSRMVNLLGFKEEAFDFAGLLDGSVLSPPVSFKPMLGFGSVSPGAEPAGLEIPDSLKVRFNGMR